MTDYTPRTLVLDHQTRIHAIPTGTVSIKKAHYQFDGITSFRFPSILLDWRWTPPLPIWTWLIEHPQGLFLVDTGENTAVYEPDYFGNDGMSRFINRRILRIRIRQEQELPNQLYRLGINPDRLDAVLLTHLHLDHTDGLRFFQRVEVLVSKMEWNRPYGAAQTTFPKGFSPKTITYQQEDLPFGKSHSLAKNVWLVPTPGHTFGHQSVVLKHGDTYFFFAGDTSFTDKQVVSEQLGGITLDWRQGRQTQQHILSFARLFPVVYLPSHDPGSGERLVNKTVLNPLFNQ